MPSIGPGVEPRPKAFLSPKKKPNAKLDEVNDLLRFFFNTELILIFFLKMIFPPNGTVVGIVA
jgi:hypothetical protein